MRKLTATLCLTLAVLLGSVGISASADFKKGLTAYRSGDYATALREWEPLAKQGSAVAQFNLGVLYRRGRGVSKDTQKAMFWFERASAQGDPSAMYEIGLIFDKGDGVEKDLIKAKEWFEAAANTKIGHAKSEMNLGNIYGQGVRDKEGNELISRNWNKAKKWWARAAEKGVARGQYNLAVLYFKGITVPKDKVKAMMWMLVSLEKNNFFEGNDRENARSAISKLKLKMFEFELNQAQKLARECIRKKYKGC